MTQFDVTETTTAIDGKESPISKSSNSKLASDQRSLAQLLYWSGGSLLGLFASLTILNSVPLALLTPEWQQKVSDNLQGFGVNALIGTVLIVLAGSFEPSSSPLRTKVQKIRHIAWWAALGWLFLIPFQTYAGIRLIRQASAQETQQVSQMSTYRATLQRASSVAELRSALAQIPGAPPLPETITENYAVVRDKIVDQFEPQIKRAKNLLIESRSKRIQAWMNEQIKDATHSFFMAFGFAAIGRRRSGKPTMLEGIRGSLASGRKDKKSPRKKSSSTASSRKTSSPA